MLRGIYTASSAMLVDQARMDVISNNMANVNTTGYKQDQVSVRSFKSMLLREVGTDRSPSGQRAVGRLGTGAEVVNSFTSHAPGALKQTGNSMDLALVGNGFFTVDTPNGERYTRSGEFRVDTSGQLVTASGYGVMGTNGPVMVKGSKFDVDADGVVSVDGQVVDRLRLVAFEDSSALFKAEGQLFAALDGAQPGQADCTVAQGQLEQSNVNIVKEMVNMINATRSYEAGQKVIQAQDETLGKAVNEVGQA